MGRTLHIAGAKQADVVALVRAELQARGARLHEQTHSRTTFDGLQGPGGFVRGGYAGVYQPMGEKDCEVRVQAHASLARRAFWAVASVELLAVLALLAAGPPSAVFVLAAAVMWPLLGLLALWYYLTFHGSAALEDELASGLDTRLRLAGLRVRREDELLEAAIRERLEGEAAQRALAERRAREPAPGPVRPARGKGALFGRKAR